MHNQNFVHQVHHNLDRVRFYVCTQFHLAISLDIPLKWSNTQMMLTSKKDIDQAKFGAIYFHPSSFQTPQPSPLENIQDSILKNHTSSPFSCLRSSDLHMPMLFHTNHDTHPEDDTCIVWWNRTSNKQCGSNPKYNILHS